MTRRLVLLGAAAQGYRALIEENLRTDWRIVSAGVDDTAGELAKADAVVAMAFDERHRDARGAKLIQVPGAGYDGIVFAAVPPKAAVCNVFEHEAGCAEYAMLAMLEWSIRLCRADRELRAGDWSRSSRFGAPPSGDLRGKTVGIVGLGRIGMEIAHRARAFGMTVLAANRTRRDGDHDVDRLVGLDALPTMAAEADFLIVCCALAPETQGLVGAAVLDAMRPAAVLVNIARGPVVEEEALWRALSERRIGGAVLDVWWQNPPDASRPARPSRFPFETLENVIMSPHIAGWTTGTIVRRGRFMAENLDRLVRGEPLLNVVRPG